MQILFFLKFAFLYNIFSSILFFIYSQLKTNRNIQRHEQIFLYTQIYQFKKWSSNLKIYEQQILFYLFRINIR